MELYIKEIDNIIATEYLMKDIKLCALALSDDSLKKLDQGQGYCPPPCSMTGFYNKKDELVCFMQATLFTESTLLIHVFLRSDLHHSGILRPITKQYSEYIHKHAPDVKKAMIMSPEPCSHVHAAVKGLGFKKEGCLTKAMVWREKLEDVIIFGRDLLINE